MRPTRTSLQPAGLASNPVPTTTVCADPADPTRCFAIRGRVVKVTAEGGAEHIEAVSARVRPTGGSLALESAVRPAL
jgi:hypothetical protein